MSREKRRDIIARAIWTTLHIGCDVHGFWCKWNYYGWQLTCLERCVSSHRDLPPRLSWDGKRVHRDTRSWCLDPPRTPSTCRTARGRGTPRPPLGSQRPSLETDQPALGPARGPATLAWSHHVTHAWTWHIIALESLARTKARRALHGPVSLGQPDFTPHLLHHTTTLPLFLRPVPACRRNWAGARCLPWAPPLPLGGPRRRGARSNVSSPSCAQSAATADGRLRRRARGRRTCPCGGARLGGSGEEEDKIQEEPGQLGVATTHHPSTKPGAKAYSWNNSISHIGSLVLRFEGTH